MRLNFPKTILLLASVLMLFAVLSLGVFAKDYSSSDAIYQKIASAIAKTQDTVDLTEFDLRTDDTVPLLNLIIADDPEYRYLDSYSISYNTETMTVTALHLTYDSYAAGACENRSAYHKELDRIASLCDPKWPDAAKALFVNDYIAAHYEYAYEDPNAEIYHYGYQLALNRRGVCEAYAEMYQKIMTRLGIPCVYVCSETLNHKWNAVRIDGEWYHVDVTWNDPTLNNVPVEGYVSHENFLLSDAALKTASTPRTDYDCPVTCSSTTYDSYFWKSISGAIAFDGTNYYYVSPAIDEHGFSLYKTSSASAGTKLGTISAPWFVGQGYYQSPFTSLWYRDGYLYFNSARALCRYKITSGEVDELKKCSDNGVGLCFAKLDGNILSANALDMNDFSKVSTVEVDITSHVHVFDQKNTNSKYLLSGATYSSAAIYYYSCTCGEKGTTTFTYGSALTTTAPVTTVKPIVTTAPVTTKTVTTSPITTKIVTTSPVTTVPITTSPVTTVEITTVWITTAPITSIPSTSVPITTDPVSSVPVTSVPITSDPVTTIPSTAVVTDIPTTPSQTTQLPTPVSTTIDTQTPGTQSKTEEKGNPQLLRVIIIVGCALVILGGVALLISRKRK